MSVALNFELLQLFAAPGWTSTAGWRAITPVPGSTPLRRTATAAGSPSSGALVDVVVLSADVALFDAIRDAIGERNPVWRARSAEESVDLLLTGRCGVLLVDLGFVSTQPATLIQQILDQFPDVVVCVAGRRSDEAQLARLISDGLVYRFMHKPLSARRAGMFLLAAIRHHCERRDSIGLREPAPLLLGTVPGGFEPWKWVFVTIGVALFVMLLAAMLEHRDTAAVEPVALAPAPAPAPPAAVSPRADPVLSRARAAFEAGRYESPAGRNALDLFKAVLLSHPDNVEAKAGLDRTIERILEESGRAVAAGHAAEAQRLVARALEADPGRRPAVVLAQKVQAVTSPQGQSPEHPSVPPATEGTHPAATGPAPAATPAPRPSAPSPHALPATPSVAATIAAAPLVRPDPLTAHIAKANATMPAVADTVRGGGRSFGAPIRTDLPIAGYVKSTPVEPARTSAANAELPRGSETAPALPAEPFEKLLVTDPIYPPQALRNRTTGWVEMEFTITESGVVRDIEVVEAEPHGVFERAATDALGHWQFRPRLVNGQPAAQRSTSSDICPKLISGTTKALSPRASSRMRASGNGQHTTSRSVPTFAPCWRASSTPSCATREVMP